MKITASFAAAAVHRQNERLVGHMAGSDPPDRTVFHCLPAEPQ
jgi:hypothetical protein